jgi:peroxiredoxin Q/BCP
MFRTTLILSIAAAAVSCSKPQNDAAPPASSAPAAKTPTAAAPRELLAVGAKAPDLKVQAHNGTPVSISDFRGRPVVVYFYPKDDTPGCTIEAQEIRDLWKDLGEAGAVVLGVSTQDNESHRAFASKYGLPFLLLPDTDHSIARAFGVPVNVMGFAKRVTFVIDRAGKIAKVYPEVDPRGHAAELLRDVRQIGT